MGTLTITLRSDKINSNDEAPIHFRLTKNRRSTYLTSGLTIPVKYWDTKNRRIKPGYTNSARANALLMKKYNQIQDQMFKSELDDTRVTTKNISDAIKGKDCPGFFELAEQLLERNKADGKISTHAIRTSVVEKFRTFLKRKEIPLTEITVQLLNKYDHYLQTVFSNSPNTRHRDFKVLKMIYREAYRLDYVQNPGSPFDKIKIKQTVPVIEFLTEEELLRIELADLGGNLKLEANRKLFLFASCAYGIRISDLILLNESQLSNDRIKLLTKKTNHQLDVKLPQKAIDILNWFRTINGGNPYVFNMVPKAYDVNDPVALDKLLASATVTYNKGLKAIGLIAGIAKPLRSHIARHSFSTRALRKGVDLYQVSTLLTHASVKQTQVYAKIVSEDLDKIADKF